jgi:hypothetical protein
MPHACIDIAEKEQLCVKSLSRYVILDFVGVADVHRPMLQPIDRQARCLEPQYAAHSVGAACTPCLCMCRLLCNLPFHSLLCRSPQPATAQQQQQQKLLGQKQVQRRRLPDAPEVPVVHPLALHCTALLMPIQLYKTLVCSSPPASAGMPVVWEP